jgi:hypothetical protein
MRFRTGLRYVEHVSGRLTTGRAAVIGIGQGGMLGLIWGLLFSLFFTTTTGGFFGVIFSIDWTVSELATFIGALSSCRAP